MSQDILITSLSHALGSTPVSSEQLEQAQGLESGFISEKTGILSRPNLGPETAPSELGATAVKRLSLAQEPDWLICATSTPERFAPPTASSVLERLGYEKAMAVDISAGCMGFLTGLALAQGLLASEQAGRVVVLSLEVMSRILDPKDYRTNVLFGDGAGAALVEKGAGTGFKLESGLQYTDPRQSAVLQVPGGAARFARGTEAFDQASPYLCMDGKAVFQFATTVLPQMIVEVCQKQGWTVGEVDWVIPHQSNLRILEKSAQTLGFPMEKVAHHLADHGNLASASIPVLMSEMKEKGELKKGQKIVLCAYGSGLAYGARAITVC